MNSPMLIYSNSTAPCHENQPKRGGEEGEVGKHVTYGPSMTDHIFFGVVTVDLPRSRRVHAKVMKATVDRG